MSNIKVFNFNQSNIRTVEKDGDVLYGGMWSYKRMEYLSLGNITERSLESILKDTKKTYIKKYTKYTNIP